MVAAAKGNERVVKQFLNNSGHSIVDASDRNGWTALTIAAKKGNTQIVSLLVENGADVNKRGGPLYQAPLRYALMNYDGIAKVNDSAVNIVKLLLEKGANPNEMAKQTDEDERNMTLLHFTAIFDQVEIMKLLLDKGANISARSNYIDDEPGTKPSVTPLMFAVQNGNENAVKILLEMGANPNATSKNCMNSFHIAIITNHTQILKILVESYRSHHLNSKTISSFPPPGNTLEEDQNRNCTETNPIMIYAAVENSTDSLKFLLETGESPNAISKAKNSTPLIGFAILVYLIFK